MKRYVYVFASMLPLLAPSQLIGQVKLEENKLPENGKTYPLYFNSADGQFTQYSGKYTQTTKKAEKGKVTLASEGPIIWLVTPEKLEIGENETKTWNGNVRPDVAAMKASKSNYATAKMKADYTLNWTVWDPAKPETEKEEQVSGTQEVTFEVIDAFPRLPETFYVLKGKKASVFSFSQAFASTKKGTWAWETKDNGVFKVVQGEKTQELEVEGLKSGIGLAQVKYTVEGLACTNEVKVEVIETPFIQVKDQIEVVYQKIETLSAEGFPKGGTWKWDVLSGSIGLTTSPNTYHFQHIMATGFKSGVVELSYTVGGQTVTKKIQVKINGHEVTMPGNMVILKGQKATITPTISPTPTKVTWSCSPELKMLAPTSAAIMQVEGVAAGKGKLSLEVEVNGEKVVRKLEIEVLNSPELMIDGWADAIKLTPGKKTKLRNGDQTPTFRCTGLPYGGTYAVKASPGIHTWKIMDSVQRCYIEAKGDLSYTITYTVQGQSVSKQYDFYGVEISKAEIVVKPDKKEVPSGTKLDYTIKIFDQDGEDMTYLVSYLSWTLYSYNQMPKLSDFTAYHHPANRASVGYTWPGNANQREADATCYIFDAKRSKVEKSAKSEVTVILSQ